MNTRNIQENQKWFPYIESEKSGTKPRTRIKTNPWVVSNAKIIVPNVSKIIIYDRDFENETIQGNLIMKKMPNWNPVCTGLQWKDGFYPQNERQSSNILSQYARINYTTCNNCIGFDWNCLHNPQLNMPWTESENIYFFNLLKIKSMKQLQGEAYCNTDVHPVVKLHVQPRNTFNRAIWNIQQRLSCNFHQLVKENKIINKRVSELKEEKRHQLQEKQRYVSQISRSKKKVLLLQTLHSLRNKLEDQRHRLQMSYTKVIDIQANISNILVE